MPTPALAQGARRMPRGRATPAGLVAAVAAPEPSSRAARFATGRTHGTPGALRPTARNQAHAQENPRHMASGKPPIPTSPPRALTGLRSTLRNPPAPPNAYTNVLSVPPRRVLRPPIPLLLTLHVRRAPPRHVERFGSTASMRFRRRSLPPRAGCDGG